MNTEVQTTHLSDQALGAIMMALQNSLLNQTDIVPVLKGLKLAVHPTNGIIVVNPPILRTNSNSDSRPKGGTIETSVQ
tara:strand:+ start:210 stop:443 length:234 start_codon:yes stop_codon:yes gene_type:complete